MATSITLTLRRATLLVAIASVIASTPAFAGRTQITVRAEFASHSFNDKVNAQKKTWEKDFAKDLARRITPLVGFMEWTPEPNPAQPTAATLLMRLTEEGGGEMPSIIVQWLIQQGTAQPELLPWPTLMIYERNDPNLAADVQTLQQHTIDALAKFPVAALQDNLLKNFTPRIPLARQLTTRSAEKVFELPLQSDDLPIGSESVMDVTFTKPGTSDGTLKLTRFGHGTSGNVRGGVEYFVLNSNKMPLTDNWNPRLDSLLNGSSVTCFLTEYKPARLVSPIATEPE
jgi:hypothetical protein